MRASTSTSFAVVRVMRARAVPLTGVSAKRLPGASTSAAVTSHTGASVPCAVTVPSSTPGGSDATTRDGSNCDARADTVNARAPSSAMLPVPEISPVPARACRRSSVTRRSCTDPANASAMSRVASRTSPRNTWRCCDTSPVTLPASRVVMSVDWMRARSIPASARFSVTAPSRTGSVRSPVARPSPAMPASTPVSARTAPSHANFAASDVTGMRPASSAPAAALVASTVPANPDPSGRAATFSASAVVGSASPNCARSTPRASRSAETTRAGANGVTSALTPTAALRSSPSAATAMRSSVPFTSRSARPPRYAASPANASLAASAKGAVAPSWASPVSVP